MGIDKLYYGYRRFVDRYASIKDSVMKKLYCEGQSPEFMVISCCDSRVDPAILFQSDPGDMFVVRNIANIVPPYKKDSRPLEVQAALEYGVNALRVRHLVLVGHNECGGVMTWRKNQEKDSTKQFEFIDDWVSNIHIDIDNVEGKSSDDCSKLSLVNSYNNCLTYPWIKEKTDKGELEIHLHYIDLQTSMLHIWNHDHNRFEVYMRASQDLTGC